MKISKRQRRIEANKLLKLPPGKFEQIDLSKCNHPDWMTRAYKNNKYISLLLMIIL